MELPGADAVVVRYGNYGRLDRLCEVEPADPLKRAAEDVAAVETPGPTE